MSRPSNDAQKARDRVKLWFFRDMTDAQRIELLKLFGLPADELGTHGAQAHGLRHVFDDLSAAESPADAHTIPEKVTTSPERVQIPAESTHVQCSRCPALMPVGLSCKGNPPDDPCPMRPA